MPNDPKHGNPPPLKGKKGTWIALDEQALHAHSLLSVVAIGASAGGLEACQHFLDAVTHENARQNEHESEKRIAYILVQHLDPAHHSLLVDLLASHTAMVVEQAKDGVRIEPDHLYIIPPGTYLSIKAGMLQLSERSIHHGARLPFDTLLHSLADAYGPRAQALILSGTGADGSLGLVSIKDKGGVVIAQEPSEARFDGMPQSAIATGQVDHVLKLADIPAIIIQHALHASHAQSKEKAPVSTLPPSETGVLDAIITLLREVTPHDFSPYKPGTLHRRIKRRMLLSGSATPEAYLALLKENAAECALLAHDMLINVTAFFRDAKVFSTLENTIIPQIIKQKEVDASIRVWVAGCSTGEEAYSIAMLFRDGLSTLKRAIKLQVFASDVDPDAITFAREGYYPESSLAHVSPERLKRYFTKEAHGYRILPELRSAMVFTVQDILSDPPFSRLDFVSCRNVLIYLGAEAQEFVISLLHFALKPHGIMLLGSAETAGVIEGRFEVISKGERLYRHIGRNRLSDTKSLRNRQDLLRVPTAQTPSVKPLSRLSFADLCRQTVLEAYAPAAMLLNTAYECLFSTGPLAQFLDISPGYPTHNVLEMVPFSVRTRLKAAFGNMNANKGKIQIEGGKNASGMHFIIEINPLIHEGEAYFLIAFLPASVVPNNIENSSRSIAHMPERDSSHVADLEQQLLHSRTELADAIRTLEQTSEEQKVLHEETLSVNEEFQSTNEELLTSKEELQSLNEELTALNNQLHEALERQRSTANDLQNILYSTHVATLFLDRDLKIRYFTPATRALFNVIPGDIGRPLADLASLAMDTALPEEARAVLADLSPIEREVEVQDGTWFARRILPYKADNNQIEGVVITFTNISDRKEIAKALEKAKKQAETANIAKSRFLAAASHDLRQPLQSLTLIQGLLAKNVVNSRGQQLVERLGQTLGAITGMMNTLLDINQIEAGTVEAKMIRFPISDLLERMRNEFLFVAQAQKIELRVVFSSRIIHSDPRLLEQMLRNLISNALKYTRRGKVLLGCRQHGNGLSIEVWDTGIGIAENQLQAIFNEYHQINNDARERNRGMGLGLAIVQRLGDLMGHRIGVRSRAGRGSVFAIEIAFKAEDVLEVEPPAALTTLPAPTRKKTGTLLVVEDDPEVSELLTLHLVGEGHRVTIAKDGETALALLSQTGLKPDVVLADYNLPNGMDGMELASKLRAELGNALPIIILTGDISSDTLRLIARGGATQLNKPVSTQEISAALQKKLAHLADEPAEIIPDSALLAHKTQIYIVDDDRQIREMLVALLLEAGIEALAFESCEAFLAAYAPNSGACLLLDAYLPGMSGMDLLIHLRSIGNTAPAIMVTGHSDVTMAVEAMKAGATDFIEKPVIAVNLLASITRAIEMGQETNEKRGEREKAAAKIAHLSTRQREIMNLILAGHPNKNIAADLGISQRTVENHRAAIMQKTESKSLPALARLAFLMSKPQ